MDTLRIKNFRSFIDTGVISINRVNVLLGKNSSGKSSFLNVFPMFKESANNELRSPFMWYNEGLYDYGSYRNAHCRFSEGKEPIVFEFGWHSLEKKKGSQCDDCGLYDRERLGLLNAKQYKLEVSINNDTKGDYLETVILTAGEHFAKVVCSKDRYLTFYLDNRLLDSKQAIWDYKAKGILPNIRFKGQYNPVSNVRKFINEIIPEGAHLKNADYEKMYGITSLNPSEIYAYYEQNRSINPFMDYVLKAHKLESKEFQYFCNDIYLSIIIFGLLYADQYLSSSFEVTSYMLPIRHVFGRYIRNRNLAVERIDSSGANVMEFLLSLKKKELESFNMLLNKVLGITVSVVYDEKDKKKEADDNRSIYIESKWGKDNIVDVGYGYTQILPIIILLWNIARNKSACEFPDIVIIEQPEVHLHPSLQGDVAKLIVEAISLAKSSKSNLQIFVETHSEAFVNRLGKYVRLNSTSKDEGIPADEVSLLLFEKKEKGTTISSTSYDKDGYIQRWPIGFLN